MDKIDIEILNLLEKDVISGEKLARKFSISRTAIWKRIKKLEELGYQFTHNKTGYKLLKITPYLLENEVRPYLKTKLIGKNYLWFKVINSSNTFAKENNLEEGTVIVAEKQTAGRGRKGRKWLSIPLKGIYFSIVLKPEISIEKLLKISLLFPLAIKKTLENYNLRPKIKWPNDVYVNTKKISGILIETDIETSQVKKIIVGIGININHTKEDLSEVKDTATSLYIETGYETDRKILFASLLNHIEEYYMKFLNDKIDVICEVEKSLLWKGEKVKILDDKNEVEGILLGLNDYGGIKLDVNGKTVEFFTGDLSMRAL